MANIDFTWDHDGFKRDDIFGSTNPSNVIKDIDYPPVRFTTVDIAHADTTTDSDYFLPCAGFGWFALNAHVDTGTMSVTMAGTIDKVDQTQDALQALAAGDWITGSAITGITNAGGITTNVLSHALVRYPLTGIRLRVEATSAPLSAKILFALFQNAQRGY